MIMDNKKMENLKETVQVITNDREIEQDYRVNVAEIPGIIRTDMCDFYSLSGKHRPVMEIIVDSSEQISAQLETAMSEIRKRGIVRIAAAILSIAFKPSSPLMMDELRSTNIFFEYNKINIKRAVQENDNISNDRSITLFIFV